MAVDGLRNTLHINRISPDQIGILWSAQSYRPEITSSLKKVKSWPNWSELSAICTNMISPGPHPKYALSGIKCLKTRHVSGMLVNSEEPDYAVENRPGEYSRYRIKSGDILLNLTGAGSIGRVGIYLDHDKPITNQHIAKLSIVKDVDSGFLVSYLASFCGERVIEQGISGSTGQLNIVNDHIRTIPVILPDLRAQIYIGDKVRQAERLRVRARELEGKIIGLFDPLSKCLESPKRAWRVPSSIIEPYRINPKQYNSVALSMIKKATEQYNLIPLGDLIDDRGVTGGATPTGAQYRSKGVFFVRVQNVSKLILDLSDAVYLSHQQDYELSRSRCAEGDLILTITGYPGTAAIVFAEDLPININQHSVRLNTIRGWPTAFIAAAINSGFGKVQVNRFAIGGTRDALDYTCVKQLLIPEFPVSLRIKTEHQTFQMYLAKRAFERLTIAARLLVDALVDGHVTETDLVSAQKALESGDRTADREILIRLTRKGMDVIGEPSLFQDIDGLYNALDTLDKPKDAP